MSYGRNYRTGLPDKGGGGGTNTLVSNLISEQTLTADSSSVTFSGLDSTVDGDYTLVADIGGVSGQPTCDIRLFVNGDTTETNYLTYWGGVPGTLNTSLMTSLYTGKQATVTIAISIVNGAFIASGNAGFTHNNGTNVYGFSTCITKPSVSSITSLTIQQGDANTSIKAGSTFRLYGSNTNKQVSVLNIEGGNASTIYLSTQTYDGGGA